MNWVTAFLKTIPAALCVLAFLPVPASSQNNLSHVGFYDSLGYAKEVVLDGGYAYVADQSLGLVILAVSDSTNPTMVGMYRPLSHWAFDIDVRGDYAYLAAGNSEPYSGALHIIDISNRQTPAVVGTYTTSWEITKVEVDSLDYAYVADYAGLKIVDISNPANPIHIINFIIPGSVLDIFKRGYYLYIASGNHGLYIIDISTPSDPQIVGTCDTPGYARGVTMRIDRANMDGFVYVADSDSGLQIIDVSNPSNPFIVGSYRASGAITDVIGGEYFVFAAVGSSSVEVIRVGYPERPVRVGYSDLPPMADGIGLDNLAAIVGGESINIFKTGFSACGYVVGDVNGNGVANGIDVGFAVNYFKGGSVPPIFCDCPGHGSIYVAGDVNGDCLFNGLDILFFVTRLRGPYSELLPCSDCPPF